MTRLIAFLAVFGVGLSLGLGNQPEKETETVFITKWKTRVVETEHEAVVEPAPMPEACQAIFPLLGKLQVPTDVLAASAGELMTYASDLGIGVFQDDVSQINREMVRIRMASDDLGTAGIDVQEAIRIINNQYTLCQQAMLDSTE